MNEYQEIRGFMRRTRSAKNLRRALDEELTDRQRQMVELYYERQRSMREIAEELGVNPSTVSRTLAAAREKLKRCMRYSARALWAEED